MALYQHVCYGHWGTTLDWSFTLHSQGSLSTGDAETAWSGAIGDLWTDITGLYTSDVTIYDTATYGVDQTTGRATAKSETAQTLAGTDSTGVLLPPQLAVVCSLRTGVLASRAERGRFYMPGPASDALDTGVLATATVGTYITGLGAMFSAMTGAGLSPAIYSRSAHTVKLVTEYDVGNVLDTQRRRRDKLTETRSTGTI